MATASGGLYLEPDSSPTSSTLSVDNDIADGTRYTGARPSTWAQNDSYGIDLGSSVSITKLSVFCVPTGGEGSVTPTGWASSGDAFSVYGSDDNSSWTLIQSFSAPTQQHQGSGELQFDLEFSATQVYRYFKVRATDSNGCYVTHSGGSAHCYIGEIEYIGASGFGVDNIVISDDATVVVEGAPGYVVEGDSITISEFVSVYTDLYTITPVVDSIEITTDVTVVLAIDAINSDKITIREFVTVELWPPFYTGNGATEFGLFSIEGFGGGIGDVEFAAFSVEGEGFVGFIGSCELEFPAFELSALAGGNGDVLFPVFTVDAAGIVNVIGSGVISFPAFVVSGTSDCILGTGELTFGSFTIEATGELSGIGNGTIQFPVFAVGGLGYTGFIGSGTVDFEFDVLGSGYFIGDNEGELIFPSFSVFGSGYQGTGFNDTILKHERDERFIT